MTTVFGIRHPHVNLAVLVADRQTTIDKPGQAPEKYLDGRKLWIAENQEYAFGHSGVRNYELNQLAENLVKGQIDVEKIVREGKFPELRELNLARLGDKIPELDKLSALLMITRFKQDTKLWLCHPLGLVEQKPWTSIGTGTRQVDDYLNALFIMNDAKAYLGNNSPTTKEGVITTGLEAVRYAQGRDIHSSGLDLVALTPDGATDCFAELQDNFKARIRAIQRKFK